MARLAAVGELAMHRHVTYHPISHELIERYIALTASTNVASDIETHAALAERGPESRERIAELIADAIRSERPFDESHGFAIAALQGLTDTYYYVHGSSMSALGAPFDNYCSDWQTTLPDFDAAESATNALTERSSGAYMAHEQVVSFMNDAHSEPELQTALAAEFPGEQLRLLWAGLQHAHQAGMGLLEAVDIVQPNPTDLAKSGCASLLENCATEGLAAYQDGVRAGATPEPDSLQGLPPAPASGLDHLPPPPAPPTNDLDHLPPPPAPPTAVATAAAAPQVGAEPMDAATTAQWWDYLVAVIGGPYGAQQHLAATFSQSRHERGDLGALAFSVFVHDLGIWLDRAAGAHLQEMCRALVDSRIGSSDEAFRNVHQVEFTWTPSGDDEVHLGLAAFDQWLQHYGQGNRLIDVATNSDSHLSIMHPAASAAQLITALGAIGLPSSFQDGSQPDPAALAAVTASPPPPEPTPAQRTESLVPAAGARLPTTKSLAERLREKREAQIDV